MILLIIIVVVVALVAAFSAGYAVGKSKFERNHYGIRKSAQIRL